MADATSPAPETRRFEAETRDLLNLVIHSLYPEKDIFLRELISNASDALDKLRHQALLDDDLSVDEDALEIRLEVDTEARTLSVIDRGIGMTRAEMGENLGTIARSGTKAFVEALKSGTADAPELIGQFGVGFYASFMAADQVVVTSRKVGTQDGARWTSRADGEFTLEDAEVPHHGTRVTLHLKTPEDEEPAQDFTSSWVLRGIVKRHSDFVHWPIRMEVESTEPVLDDEGKPKEGETRTVTKDETLNSQTPLWTRPKAEITDEEHADFYRHVSHDWQAPLAHLLISAESPVEYKSLLYVPAKKAVSPFADPKQAAQLALYVKRVLIMPECEELLPSWLRFVKGVVDCADLPLNVSRQTLQANPIVARIQKHLISKVLGLLKDTLAKDREAYAEAWAVFGPVLKEGIYHGKDDDGRISGVCLFPSTQGEGLTTLAEYVERMGEDQEAIHVLTGLDLETLRRSPQLEAYTRRGEEVLLLADPVDEWMLQHLKAWDEKPLQLIQQGAAALESEEEKAQREAQQEEHKDLLEQVQKHLDDHVSAVRFSSRLVDSPAVLVGEDGDLGPAMARMMAEMNQGMGAPRPALELNPEHLVVKRLVAQHAAGTDAVDVEEQADLLLGLALLAEGRTPPDPIRFGRLVADRMLVADAVPDTPADD